jgi:hypothetical protein
VCSTGAKCTDEDRGDYLTSMPQARLASLNTLKEIASQGFMFGGEPLQQEDGKSRWLLGCHQRAISVGLGREPNSPATSITNGAIKNPERPW